MTNTTNREANAPDESVRRGSSFVRTTNLKSGAEPVDGRIVEREHRDLAPAFTDDGVHVPRPPTVFGNDRPIHKRRAGVGKVRRSWIPPNSLSAPKGGEVTRHDLG